MRHISSKHPVSCTGIPRTAGFVTSLMALPRNFADFVCDAYRYLMDYYRSGDKVYLFGFSRGAYEARALAGMVEKVRCRASIWQGSSRS